MESFRVRETGREHEQNSYHRKAKYIILPMIPPGTDRVIFFTTGYGFQNGMTVILNILCWFSVKECKTKSYSKTRLQSVIKLNELFHNWRIPGGEKRPSLLTSSRAKKRWSALVFFTYCPTVFSRVSEGWTGNNWQPPFLRFLAHKFGGSCWSLPVWPFLDMTAFFPTLHPVLVWAV